MRNQTALEEGSSCLGSTEQTGAMAAESDGTVEMPALSRPLRLGMLYDSRKDAIVSGMTLWDHDDLMKHIRERPQNYNSFGIVASESVEDKYSNLDVNGSLKGSVLLGLVEAEGSAKILNHGKTTKNQASVMMTYKATTKVQELSMDHLGRVKHQSVIKAGVATHVITAVLYGAQAFFVFERGVSETEDKIEIQQNIEKSIGWFYKSKSKSKDDVKIIDKAKAENLSCQFYGDFCLQKTPSTFREAIEVYQSLPRLLGANGEKAVPVKVWMLPLTRLDPSAAKLHQLSSRFLQNVESILENFSDLEMRCKDALKSKTVQHFPQMEEKLKRFKEMSSLFKQKLREDLAKKLPLIRGGEVEEEAVIAEILTKSCSPFNSTDLNQWVDCKETEISILQSLTNMMKNSNIISSEKKLFEETLSAEHAVCFVFTSLGCEEPYLSALSSYLQETNPDAQCPQTHDVKKEQWYTVEEVLHKVKIKAKLFSDFAEANKENKNTKFLMVGLPDETHKGSTVYLFKDGFSITKNFEPPSKPETVTVAEINHNSVTLKVSPPRYGAENITSYSVEFCVNGEEGWRQETAPKSGEVTLNNLRPNTEYVFRCRAVTSAGVGPVCDVTDPIRTSPCSPPEGPQVETSLGEMTVSWDRPAVFGRDVQVLHYIVEYAETEGGANEEDLQWKQRTSTTQSVSVPRLQSDTGYAVRVICDCGGAGRSRESLTVVCRTPDTYLLLLQEVLHDFPQLETRCTNALESTTVQQFPQIVENLETFTELCMDFKKAMLLKLKDKVSSVLSGEEKKPEVMKMTEMRNKTGFKETHLSVWMDYREREIQVLQSLTQKMKNTEVIPTYDIFDEKIHSAEHVLIHVFTSLGDPGLFLSVLSENRDMKDEEHISGLHIEPTEQEQWFRDTHDDLNQKVKLFIDFQEANKDNKNTKFLMVGLPDETHKGSTIYLFKDGISITKNFEPPSKPETVTVAEINHNSVTLKVSPPRYGAENITSYSVEFCINGEEGWRQETAPKSGEVTLNNLRPNTEYVFRCRAVTSAGVGPVFDVTDPIKTSPCSPPEVPQVETSLGEMTVSWDRPAVFGRDVQVLHYIVEYAETEGGANEEDLQWKQRTSTTQSVSVPRLQSDTGYAVRVICDCGGAGRSRESLTVVCRTPDTYLLLLREVLHDFPQLETRCTNALESTTVQQFPQIVEKLELFTELCTDFKKAMLLKLKDNVPSVLSGEEKEPVVTKMTEMRNKTGFRETHLSLWMDYKEREMQVLQSLTQKMKNTEFIPTYDIFDEKIHSAEHVLIHVFTSLGDPELFLSVLSENRDLKAIENFPGSHIEHTDLKPWFMKIQAKLSQEVKLFSDFAEANKDNKNTKFLMVGLLDETHKGSTVYLFKDGISITKNFEPPSKPETVTVAEINHNSVTLEVSPPRYGAENITSYSVEFCINGEEGWRQETAPKSGEVTLNNLRPNTEYVFRCRAVTSAGVGPACDVSGTIRTSPCSTPEGPVIEPNSCEITVFWKKPAVFGRDVQVSGYSVEYAETEPGLIEEDLQWKEVMTTDEKVVLSGLQLDSEYAVRVRCICGEDGRSNESLAISLCTTTWTYPAEFAGEKSRPLKYEFPSAAKPSLTEEDEITDGSQRCECGKQRISGWVSRSPDEVLQEVLPDFSNLEVRCNEALASNTAGQFPQISEKVRSFTEMCFNFKQKLNQMLAKKLLLIQGRQREEAVITEIRRKRCSSPFNPTDLNQWVDCKETEISILQSLTNMMKNSNIISSEKQLFEETLSAEHAVCFVFTSLGCEEPYLSALSSYLKEPRQRDQRPQTHDVKKDQWYTIEEVLDEVKKKAKLFSDFAEANKENKNMKFLMVGLPDRFRIGSTIYLLKDGFSITKYFEPPSKPETVTVAEINHNSVTLKVSPPRYGAENITSYSVEFCVNGEEGWRQESAPKSGEVTLNNLRPNTEYVFRCRAVISAGVGPVCDVTDPIRTSPCSPPEGPQVETSLGEMTVSWDRPAVFGRDVQVLHYIVEYAETEEGANEEDLQWKLRTSTTQSVSVPRLQSDTGYAVRVICDCGGAGRSRESLTVVCRTPDTYLLLLQEVLHDLPQLETRHTNALESTTVQQFPQIVEKLELFTELCTDFKKAMLLKLKDNVPSVLSGEEKEPVVTKMTEMRNKTGFRETHLSLWMDYREREIQVLQSLTQKMRYMEIIESQRIFTEKIHCAENVVTFVFTSLGDPELYLSSLSKDINIHEEEHLPGSHVEPTEQEPWFIDKHDDLSQKLKLLKDFQEANEENKNTKFLMVGLPDETHKGSTIYLFKDGISITKNFEPPSKPASVTETEIKHNSVTLKVSPPRYGAENITSYSVEFCINGEEGWRQERAPKSGEVTLNDLTPNTEYVFRCRAVTSAGVGPVCDVTDPIRTSPCSPPGQPHINTDSSKILVIWEKPAELGRDVELLSYIVEYAEAEQREDLRWTQTVTTKEKVIFSGLQSDTDYIIRVTCDCGRFGRSGESLTIHVRTTKYIPELLRRVSERTRSECPSVYQLPMTEQDLQVDGCRRFHVGQQSRERNRTVVVMGVAGCGKSRLINAIINYIVGVEWKDDFRFTLMDEDSCGSQPQTSEVAVYHVHHQDGFRIDHSLTIVNAPGLGGTAGIERDKLIVEHLRSLVSHQDAVVDIDALCLVAPAASPRLTADQKYVFNSMLSIFGDDVLENMMILVTSADDQQPPVLDVIKTLGIQAPRNEHGLPVHFKFNSSALFANNKPSAGNTGDGGDDDDDRVFHQMIWNMETTSMKKFFASLDNMDTKSLTLTKKMIRERKHLESSAEALQQQIRVGLARLAEIQETRELPGRMTGGATHPYMDISVGRIMVLNEFEITIMKSYRNDHPDDRKFLLNCQQCHMTCQTSSCAAEGEIGLCTECPGKCPPSVHFLQRYRWEYEEETVKMMAAELRQRYPRLRDGLMHPQRLTTELASEYNDVEGEVMELLEKSAECLNRLKEMSQTPNPVSTAKYISLIISGEMLEDKPGQEKRVESLKRMRLKMVTVPPLSHMMQHVRPKRVNFQLRF
ncbi:uncharacterized protein LOC133452562 [Cololabis saira]|uniref:uncharacterized protein LOC133452562 n=1 Tax=Cololabis saira TaxID=129043 RepID=UPI002AD4F7E2|nr:uncharacterized protein LOC133452562 [Cololabis saira]